MPSSVTTSSVDASGTVRERPESLAQVAGLDLETYALGRLLASEHGNGTPTEKAAVAWAVVNEAIHRNMSIMGLVGYVSGVGYTGTFGQQNQGRFASTRQDPTPEDVEVARRVLGRSVGDLTLGSRKWFNPTAQDALYREGRRGYTRTAAQVMEKWQGEGWQPVYPYGIDAERLVFFRRGDATVAQAGVGGSALWLAVGFGIVWWLSRRRR